MNLEKYEEIRNRALASYDPDEIARIMDELDPWEYPPLGLYELLMHLRAALYKNIAHMFFNIELTMSAEDVKKVDEITSMLKENLDEKGNIRIDADENVKNMLTWLASLEGKMDIYDPKLSARIIKRYISYAGGMLSEVFIQQLGFKWEIGIDADNSYLLKKGDVEAVDPSNSVYKQLIVGQEHLITVFFNKFSSMV